MRCPWKTAPGREKSSLRGVKAEIKMKETSNIDQILAFTSSTTYKSYLWWIIDLRIYKYLPCHPHPDLLPTFDHSLGVAFDVFVMLYSMLSWNPLPSRPKNPYFSISFS